MHLIFFCFGLIIGSFLNVVIYCRKQISLQYPLVELMTGMVFTLTYHLYGLSPETLIYCILSCILISVSFIDIKLKIIPNQIIVFGLMTGLAINIIWPFESFLGGLIGFISSGSFFLGISVLSKGGMGGGDIKLAAMIGLWLGWRQAMLGFLLAFALGAIIGILLVITGRKTRKDYIPFGPYIAIGTLIGLFWGNQIVSFYLNNFLRQ